MADPVLLDDEKLVKLAKVVYNQEAEAAKHCKCNSEIERSNCIRETKVCYNTVLGLLDSVKQLKKEYEDGDKNLSSIANDIFSYVVYAVNNALQFVSNYSLRNHYLDKISENAKALIRALKEIDPNNVTNVQRLAKDAIIFRNAMLEYVRKKNRPISRYFAKWLKETGLSFGKLTQRYQNKLNFQGQFRNLEDAKKLQVYNKIIEASGRGRITVNQVSKALGATGMAVLIFTAAIAVWDVYTSDNKLQTAARDTLQFIGAAGGGTLGEYAATALATGLLGAAASPVFVVAAGIVGGIAGAYILGKFAAHLVDEVFSWGDTDNITHLNDQIHFHQCCVAPAPNGNVLARPIARHDEL
ncbi:hypothetical protein FEM48_Zijuj01G0223800 [Ziziphus jujuba var. spinosa]|uniref:Uncharacterized protein n=1 Tax=Ziziphus jujuba var. spinosa TaxID=714518 RepID=A0A978W3W5_ZIZJJ|nr:hypothetical protein FEM48_Zijuj01G0223800 [Ziziphus jujuba var. spinosa]